MDGQFVPNLTFGPDVIASARSHTSLPFEAHLMVLTPDVMAKRYVEAGCTRLIVHAEACTHLHRTLENIRSMGATAGVALNPHTPASEVAHVLDLVDLVLVMTVNPGFGGTQDSTGARHGRRCRIVRFCPCRSRRRNRTIDGLGCCRCRCELVDRRQRALSRPEGTQARYRRPARTSHSSSSLIT